MSDIEALAKQIDAELSTIDALFVNQGTRSRRGSRTILWTRSAS
jgi:hypothetical protein